MDFLDPKTQRRHAIQLMVGYVCVAVAILIATLILLYTAYGFGYGKNGQIVQKGFVYVSSTPSGSNITISGSKNTPKTNARLSLVSGDYQMTITRDGYRDWQRSIEVDGNSVVHYDYPFLFPKSLKTVDGKTYASAPDFVSQSPDQRWLIVKSAASNTSFDEYDLKNPKQAALTLTLPVAVSSSDAGQAWQVVEWASDNQHVLLSRTIDGKPDFVLLDRNDPALSYDLNIELGTSPSKMSLLNKKYDQYYVYDSTTQALQTVTLNDKILTPFLQHVLAYQPYGSNIMLYVSSSSSGSDKVSIDLLQDNRTYALREVAANSNYVINLAQYSHYWYLALGASSENRVYVFKNPVSQLNSKLGVLVPIYVLKLPSPNYLAFSNNAQFIAAESGSQFAVFDAENDKGYSYDTKAPLDAPQIHASWMDGDRLLYTSGGKLIVFDYDHANPQTLIGADPAFVPAFDVNYKFVDTLSTPAADGSLKLQTTQLRTAADQ